MFSIRKLSSLSLSFFLILSMEYIYGCENFFD